MNAAIDVVKGGLSYLRSNPMYLFQAARNAARLNLSVPIDLLRWLIDRRPRGKGPERIDLTTSGSDLHLSLTVDLYGTKIDVDANVAVEAIENRVDELTVALRVSGLDVKAPEGSPAAMMIGSLDLKRPGSLMNMMPQKHAALVEASDDRFVIDLLKIKKLAHNRKLRRALAALADVLAIREVRADGDIVVVGLSLNPLALPGALARLRSL